MKYEYSSNAKKIVKKTADTAQILLRIKDTIQNPIRTIIDKVLDKGSSLNTKRKQSGKINDRDQIFNPKLKRFVKRDTKTGKIISVKSDRNPYKNIPFWKGLHKKKKDKDK